MGTPAHRPWHRAIWHGPESAPDGGSPLLGISVPEVLDALASLSDAESQYHRMLPHSA